jgi:hypothetical protein
MKKRHLFIGCIIMLSMIMFSNANAQSSEKDKASAKIFVQQFYDWYVVLYNTPVKKNALPKTEAAIKKHLGFFESRLSNSLIHEAWTQARAKGEIVGLDFDPFLAAQDIGLSYVAGDVKKIGNKFQVDIHSGLASKSKQLIPTGKVTVIAEVEKSDGVWNFTNFYYPEGQKMSNLMKMLANLRKQRGEFGN